MTAAFRKSRVEPQSDFARPFSVLQVIPNLDTGGVEQTVIDISDAIVKAGGKSVVASQGGRLADRLKDIGAKLVKLPVHSKNPFVQWQNIAALKKIILRERIDIVHVRSRAPAIAVLRAAHAMHIPSVSTYHGIYNASSPLKRWYNSMMTRTDVIIANSSFTREHILNTYEGLDPDAVIAVARGIDMQGFDPDMVSADRQAALRAHWGIVPDDGRTKFLLAGRMTRWKGHTLIIEAAKRLRDMGHNDFVIYFAGDDQGRTHYSQEISLQVRAAQLEDHIQLVGHCSDMPAAYLICDFALAPSLEPEAFGRTAVEPQAMLRPVLAANHGATGETVIPDVTGFLIPPRDATAWAMAMTRAMQMTPQAREEIGFKGRAHVLGQFSLDVMCDKTLDIYRGLLRNQR